MRMLLSDSPRIIQSNAIPRDWRNIQLLALTLPSRHHPRRLEAYMFQSPKLSRQSCRFPMVLRVHGPNGLRPQHLKDMIGPCGDGAADNLVRSLAAFAALVLSGEVPVSIRPFIFGANITTLQKKRWWNSPHCCWLHPSSSCCQGGWC